MMENFLFAILFATVFFGTLWIFKPADKLDAAYAIECRAAGGFPYIAEHKKICLSPDSVIKIERQE